MARTSFAALIGAVVLAGIAASNPVQAQVIGVSWSNFQEERWKTDEAAIKAAIAAGGGTYVSADAQSSAAKQITDIEALIARGAKALIVLAQDANAIRPAVEKAINEGIPVIGYDRLIEMKDVLYITFDNKEVGRIQAREVFKVKPDGNYVFIKGSSADPNANFLFSGQMEVLGDAIKAGKVKNVGEAYTDGWLPANAQRNMEQFLTANRNKVDAVVASNDGTAGGAIAALAAQGMAGLGAGLGPGRRPRGAEPRRARHADRERVEGRAPARPHGGRAGDDARQGHQARGPAGHAGRWADGPRKVAMTSILLTPVPITKDNLDVVIQAGWVSKDVVCRGVKPGGAKPCN